MPFIYSLREKTIYFPIVFAIAQNRFYCQIIVNVHNIHNCSLNIRRKKKTVNIILLKLLNKAKNTFKADIMEISSHFHRTSIETYTHTYEGAKQAACVCECIALVSHILNAAYRMN